MKFLPSKSTKETTRKKRVKNSERSKVPPGVGVVRPCTSAILWLRFRRALQRKATSDGWTPMDRNRGKGFTAGSVLGGVGRVKRPGGEKTQSVSIRQGPKTNRKESHNSKKGRETLKRKSPSNADWRVNYRSGGFRGC